MKPQYASQNPTLLEIAQVLGIQPDTVLQWIIEGKLFVALQGSRTVLMVHSNQTLKTRNPGKILILTKPLANQTYPVFFC